MFISGTAKTSKLIFSELDSTTLAAYFSKTTEDLIKSKSFGKDVKYVDIVSNVINIVPVHWISEEIVSLVDLFYFFEKSSDVLCRLDFR